MQELPKIPRESIKIFPGQKLSVSFATQKWLFSTKENDVFGAQASHPISRSTPLGLQLQLCPCKLIVNFDSNTIKRFKTGKVLCTYGVQGIEEIPTRKHCSGGSWCRQRHRRPSRCAFPSAASVENQAYAAQNYPSNVLMHIAEQTTCISKVSILASRSRDIIETSIACWLPFGTGTPDATM